MRRSLNFMFSNQIVPSHSPNLIQIEYLCKIRFPQCWNIFSVRTPNNPRNPGCRHCSILSESSLVFVVMVIVVIKVWMLVFMWYHRISSFKSELCSRLNWGLRDKNNFKKFRWQMRPPLYYMTINYNLDKRVVIECNFCSE